MKNEMIGYIFGGIALIACCFLLTSLIVGGSLGLLGIYFKDNRLIILGVIVILVLVISIIISKRKDLKNILGGKNGTGDRKGR